MAVSAVDVERALALAPEEEATARCAARGCGGRGPGAADGGVAAATEAAVELKFVGLTASRRRGG